MRAGISRALLGALIFMFGAAGCGYDPHPASGMLKCGPSNSCPDNYSCMSGRCVASCQGGGGGAAAEKFVGRWMSDPTTAKRVRVCTDGTNETIAWDDYLDIMRGACAPLAANYYCDWDLDVASGGNATAIRAGSMCSAPDMTDPSIMFTWHGMALTLTTTDGTAGSIAMSLPYEYTTATGSGSCTMMFTGPMTKN
jgi:hypothetical protein